MEHRRSFASLVLLAAPLALGCSCSEEPGTDAPADTPAQASGEESLPYLFVDVTSASGLGAFRQENGDAEKLFIVESFGVEYDRRRVAAETVVCKRIHYKVLSIHGKTVPYFEEMAIFAIRGPIVSSGRHAGKPGSPGSSGDLWIARKKNVK